MGMDVYGKKPDSEVGKYFRNNVWWWRPLADYCLQIGNGLASKCEYWHSNDGDGLGARDSKKLASLLKQELDSGRTKKYADHRQKALDAIPDEDCEICGGTGKRLKRLPPPAVGPGAQVCNGCNGTGKIRPWNTNYPFSVENVQEFVEFLQHCGGFKIW